jgi:small-conductance mechanosensitive channel
MTMFTRCLPPASLARSSALFRLWRALWLGGLCAWCWAVAAAAVDPATEAPVVLAGRTIVVFRAPLGAFSAADRAQGALQRIQRLFDTAGQGWTSVRPQAQGLMVELDGAPVFLLLPEDVPQPGEATLDGVANEASRALQAAWRDARERRDPRAGSAAVLKVMGALLALLLSLALIWHLSRRVRDLVTSRLAQRVGTLPDAALASRLAPILLGLASRACVLLACLASLLLIFIVLAFSLDQFPLTRAMGEGLYHAFASLLLQSLGSAAAALPGLFVAALIFLVAWLCTQVSTELFQHVAAGQIQLGMLDRHTAPATRTIVNASLWLFALAMAYPYLPGAQTDAFKGLSVLLGIMVSIGASGVVGQIASGVILVYTRALLLGEYVRIHECEGTVTEIGLFVTRLRTGMGAEIALPNALVLGNVTRNFSRASGGDGLVLDTTVSIGYDTPWRQVHAMLLEAAASVPHVAQTPAPRVLQTSLADAYVVYRLVVHVNAERPAARAQVSSDLHAAIQDLFNRYGVQIMSPNYLADPAQPKIVPEAQWYAPPAKPPASP